MDTFLSSERLLFREWREGDESQLYPVASDPLVGPMAGWQPHKSIEDSLSIIRTILSEENTFAIIEKESGKIIGSTGLFPPQEKTIEIEKNEIEIGYWIARDRWGLGYGTETLKRMIDYAFSTLKMNKVWCGAYIENNRSIRVQEKCGFVFSHIEKVHVAPLNKDRNERFSFITKVDWLSRSMCK